MELNLPHVVRHPTNAALMEKLKENRNTKDQLGSDGDSGSDNDSEEGLFEVESLRSKRMHNGKVEYEVKWLGYPKTTWEEGERLKNVTRLLEEIDEEFQCHGKGFKRKSSILDGEHAKRPKNRHSEEKGLQFDDPDKKFEYAIVTRLTKLDPEEGQKIERLRRLSSLERIVKSEFATDSTYTSSSSANNQSSSSYTNNRSSSSSANNQSSFLSANNQSPDLADTLKFLQQGMV